MRVFILALAVLAFTAVNAHAQTPNARVFSGGAGLILYTIKPGSTADFETVLNKAKEALTKSEKPERKQQAASWRVYKSDAAAANGNVTYVMIIDPAVKEADYNIVNILNEAFPAEIQALFKQYTEAFASGLIPINLVSVVVEGDRAVINWVFDYTTADGTSYRMDEIAIQTWRDGKIVHERYIYDTGSLAVAA